MAAKKTSKAKEVVTPPVMDEVVLPEAKTKAQATANENAKIRARKNQQQKLVQFYRAEEKCRIRFAPFYAPYLGKVVRIAMNGISTYVPCNGRTYEIPASLAAEAHRKRRAVDDHINKMEQGADVQNNFDGKGSPGTLRLD